MSIGYLDILDELLSAGCSSLSRPFRDCQARYVAARQQPDGGFPGRQGGSDLYYTDFALRILAQLASDADAARRAGQYIAQHAPHNLIACFNLLHAARLLRQCGIAVPLDAAAMRSCLARHRLPGGGFMRQRQNVSAYATFLAALCYEMLDEALPDAARAVAAIAQLRCADGGYGEAPGGSGQTNATAAALALLIMQNARDDREEAVQFLVRMQSEDGGIGAHPRAQASDLLSTFTGCLTLYSVNALDRLDLPRLARFLRRLAHPEGGFHAGLLDTETDIEYTYYGIGTLALLRAYVTEQERICG